MLDISIEGLQEIQSRLNRINQRAGNLRPLLLEIGDYITESTKQRFEGSKDPMGNDWQANSAVTLQRKSGTKPLINHGNLMRSIHYQLSSDGYGVEIGTNAEQAAMMQFGGTKTDYPNLWGDIIGRPFSGLSAADGRRILELSEAYLFD